MWRRCKNLANVICEVFALAVFAVMVFIRWEITAAAGAAAAGWHCNGGRNHRNVCEGLRERSSPLPVVRKAPSRGHFRNHRKQVGDLRPELPREA